MSDLLIKLNRHPLTARLVRALGLPNPISLLREAGPYRRQPLASQRVLLLAAPGALAANALHQALVSAGAAPADTLPADGPPAQVVVLDATGCRQPADYQTLYAAFQPLMRRIVHNGRVMLVAADPGGAADPVAAAVARGVEGFTRSLAKELGARGVTANLAYVAADAVDRLDGVVRFFCGAQATYVTGQALRVGAAVQPPAIANTGHPAAGDASTDLPPARPLAALAGKVALVTGAARGIGLATAERLAQEGAQVLALDVPAAAQELEAACARIGARPLVLDIAAANAPETLAARLLELAGGVDIVVHNAGITRDKTLARMQREQWEQVVAINLAAIAAIDRRLLDGGVLRDHGRIVCLSSISGVAGNFGQTNYATTKAALIGYVAAQATLLAHRGICINAVAPGFIETAMTARMPFLPRELGRRLNSLKQGGQPRDVAEAIAFLCTPGASGISGQTLRVCGQAMLGA